VANKRSTSKVSVSAEAAATSTSTPEAAPSHDVAISFLVRDQDLARSIRDDLKAAGLEVFFFPHKQEELAGTNGMETMRAPFLDARVNVVLFRKPWGETPWTRVEDGAISDRCWKGGWSSLMFVQLDAERSLPKWLSPTHVRFNFGDYGLKQLVGAIKMRVQEQGGKLRPMDAATKAEAVKREADYLALRNRSMRDGHWIRDLHTSIREMLRKTGELVERINVSQRLEIEFGTKDHTGVLRSRFVSVVIGWKQPFGNEVDYESGECYLRVAEFVGRLLLPDERGYYIREPKQRKEHKFTVDVAEDGSLIWRLRGKNGRIEPSQLADIIVQIFLELLSQANRGNVEPPHM
jgi:hypothetical protein